MNLPEFLKKEPEIDDFPEFQRALKQYKEHFGCGVSTAELIMSKEEIIEMVDECIESGVTWEEYLKHPGYDDDTDY